MVKKISLLVLAFAFFTAFQVQAQTITGRVTSKEDPMGIPGVAVQIKNTTIGTTTDIDGKYSLSVPQGKTVVFTSTGMKPQEIVVGSQTTIDVLMEPSLTALEGVTVSGYGVSRKQGAGTSTNVASDAIKRQTEANVANSLQGAVPGLQVSAASGSPGGASTVKLRGTSSMGLSSSQPLYIIDGVPVAAGNFGSRSTTTTDPLSSINPDDIETMTVLKDASATSIYGARASNGVILITTKRGKEGASNLQLNAKIGVATTPYIPRKWRMIDADDYITLMTEGYMNSHKNTDFNKAYAALAKQNYWDKDINKVAKTDWWDEVTQTGLVQDYNLSASGGNEKST